MDVSEYIEHHREKAEQEKREAEHLFIYLNRLVKEQVQDLAKKYNPEKIYLFGSLLDRDKFCAGSDIDLAISGLEAEDYLDFWGDLEERLQHSFDLVNLETADNRLNQFIRQEGVVIYDRKKEESQFI
ncbi:nucleotidyltransferase family protein [Halarsenatibacter silvermanii]|uniref:Nucleotidyltransferase domain-containing protein n=1 Tax=Halarsenatibacter silvermanii TaxID=321763 RepID=A0A1G9TRK0_9FIRM|nr:nucleotidyltransferase domain-containing protein [Halarsenatibacter silvermanii]SDM50054.1 Nucleotidyltransferase domain-containing protein [Halarsenatibacter silvermanii]